MGSEVKLGSIEVEARACRAAWKGSRAEYGWHIHHQVLVEALTDPIADRIAFILSSKPKAEQALRLRLLRPVKSRAVAPASKAYNEAVAPARKAYDEARTSASKAYNEAVAPARKAYDEALTSARKAYDEAVAPAWKAYDEAVAPAWKAYDEAVASASKAYDEALAPARKAYDEALASASKAYDEALAPAHAKDCPGCPWNGTTIFAEVAK